MEEEMRLKVAESVVDIPGPRLHNIHNAGQGDRNRNQQEKLADSTALHSSQWASNYVTTPNSTSLLKDHLTTNGSNFNNNITATLQQQQQHQQQQQQRVHCTSYSASSDLLSESSPDDSLGDYDVDAQQSSSSLDVSPQGDEYRCFSHDELSDSDLSDDGNCHSDLHPCVAGRGIVNPNYPGFQHLAHQLNHSDTDEADDDVAGEADNNNAYNNNNLFNNNNNNEDEENGDFVGDDGVGSKIDGINHLDSVENFQKAFYDKPKFNIPVETKDEEVCDGQISTVLDLVNDFNVELLDAIDGGVRVGEEHIESLFVEETVENFEPVVVEVVELEADSAEASVAGDASRGETVFSEIRKYIVETVFVDDELPQDGLEEISHIDSVCDTGATEEVEQDLTDLVAEETIDTVFSEIRKYVETVHLEDRDLEIKRSAVTNEETYPERENVVAEETIETVFSEIRKYVETVFLEDDEPESIENDIELKETSSDLERELKETEDIETALADVRLNESLFADLENIKTAFADDGSKDHKTADKFAISLSSGCGSFVDVDLKTFNSKREKHHERRVDKLLSASTMATTVIGLPGGAPQQIPSVKLEDAVLSNSKEEPPRVAENIKCDQLLKPVEKKEMCLLGNQPHGDSNRATDEREKFIKEEQLANEKEKDEDSVVPRKKEKMEINYSVKKNRQCISGSKGVTDLSLPLSLANGGVVRRREFGPRTRDIMMANRRSMPVGREKKRLSPEGLGSFDVYNIETAMPKIDLDAIESHLKAAREEDRRRRNDREEIRKRLAMGSDVDEYYGGDRPGRKPSLQARLQSGMNLQICFMNETVSDTESPNSDTEPSTSPTKLRADKAIIPQNYTLPLKSPNMASVPPRTRPSPSSLTLPLRREPDQLQPMTEADFFARQARLQAEARMALAQAKEMAHMQMEIERQRQKKSPITEMVRSSLEKVGIPFPEDRRRVSRQILTEMNLAQLQVIVNDLHTQIEVLNENLVKFLMNRDDLHMEQDSMLVDIEDLTRYLGAKEQPAKEQKDQPSLPATNNLLLLTNKPKLNRIAGLVKK